MTSLFVRCYFGLMPKFGWSQIVIHSFNRSRSCVCRVRMFGGMFRRNPNHALRTSQTGTHPFNILIKYSFFLTCATIGSRHMSQINRHTRCGHDDVFTHSLRLRNLSVFRVGFVGTEKASLDTTHAFARLLQLHIVPAFSLQNNSTTTMWRKIGKRIIVCFR